MSAARAAWKAHWRLVRIARREIAKAYNDFLLCGTGFVRVGPDIPIEYIPLRMILATGGTFETADLQDPSSWEPRL